LLNKVFIKRIIVMRFAQIKEKYNDFKNK